jgi:hypothetical protein
MNSKKNKDDFDRKDFFRKKHSQNKNFCKKTEKITEEDYIQKKTKKENKKRMEDLRSEELWEDWESYGDQIR